MKFKFTNKKEAHACSKVVIVGRQPDPSQSAAISAFFGKNTEIKHVSTRKGIEPNKEFVEQFKESISGDEPKLIITGLGETGVYQIKDIWGLERGKNSLLMVWSDRNEVLGNYEQAKMHLEVIQGESKIFTGLDFIFPDPLGKDALNAMLRLARDTLDFRAERGKLRLLLVDEHPMRALEGLRAIHSVNQEKAQVLLARNFEEANGIFSKSGETCIGVVANAEMVKAGEGINGDARHFRQLREDIWKLSQDMPIVVYSGRVESLSELGARGKPQYEIDTNRYELGKTIEKIMKDYFGYDKLMISIGGEKDAMQIGTLYELFYVHLSMRKDLFDASHAQRVVNWLRLHDYQNIAEKIAALKMGDLKDYKASFFWILNDEMHKK